MRDTPRGRSSGVAVFGRSATPLAVVALATLLGAVTFLLACTRPVDVVSRTTLTGAINGSPVEGRVTASFNTSRGGRSSCEFDRLPVGFTPGTLSTHA
jgi:hypothetical protein